MTEAKIIRTCEVVKLIGLSRVTLWRMCRSGDFPQAIRLGGTKSRAVGWRVSEVESWIESRPAATGKEG